MHVYMEVCMYIPKHMTKIRKLPPTKWKYSIKY